MDRILLSANYPNLKELGLYHVETVNVKQFFTDTNLLNSMLRNQIISLTIDYFVRERANYSSNGECIFTDILTTFTNLQYLNTLPYSIRNRIVSFHYSPANVSSSNLLELHVRLDNFTDCLYVFDGRFDRLRSLFIHISVIYSPKQAINQTTIPNLKCFSLECESVWSVNNEFLTTLVHRMLNLEELNLCLVISDMKTVFDGNHLKELINNMTKLNKCTFNIRSSTSIEYQMNMLSNEDIRYTFKDFPYSRIIFPIEHFPKDCTSQYHFYSYPHIWKVFDTVTNSFPGGLFQSFLYLRKRRVVNEEPQKK